MNRVPSTSAAEASARATNPQTEPARFRVLSIQQLQSRKQGAPRLHVTDSGEKALPLASVTVRAVQPGAGCTDYASDSGVVLRPLQTSHEPSGSTLVLRGVFWDERILRQVASGEEDVSSALHVGREFTLGATAHFQNLPSALHTYMLAIGTSARPDRVRIRVGEHFSQPGGLVANTEMLEARVPFTY